LANWAEEREQTATEDIQRSCFIQKIAAASSNTNMAMMPPRTEAMIHSIERPLCAVGVLVEWPTSASARPSEGQLPYHREKR
jgi:hypothetical protein